MTEQEAQALMNAGAGIDAAEGLEQAEAAQMPMAGGMAPAGADDGAMDWIIIPETLAMVICMALPECEPFYSDEGNMKFAARLAAVGKKYGWSGASSTPEIGLAIGAAVFMTPAYMMYKNRQAAAAQERQGATLNGKPVINGQNDGN